MDKKYLVIFALGCLLSDCNLLVQSLPLRHLENQLNGLPASLIQGNPPSPEGYPLKKSNPPSLEGDLLRKNINRYQAPQEPLESSGDAGKGPYAPGNRVGMRLFPKLYEDGSTWKMRTIQSQSRVGFFPQDDGKGGQSQSRVRFFPQDDGKGGPTAGKVGTEMTVSVPRLVKDRKGNWVYDKWGATFGVLDQDTRFKEFYRGRAPTPMFRAGELIQNYYPKVEDEDLNTVCNFRSTLYNFPKVYDWITPRLRRYSNRDVYLNRPIWLDLRKELYTDGNSLQCHQPEMKDWDEYIMCALMRNMRMEYLIPQYPLIQKDFRFQVLPENMKYGD